MNALNRLLTLVIAPIVLCGATGCQLMSGNGSFSGELPTGQDPNGQANASMVTVELYPFRGRMQRKKLPLNEMMSVQRALEQSGAIDRFRKMKFVVVRTDPKTGRQIKMGGDYQPERRHVAVSDDYALHPGDRVLVKEDLSATALIGPLTRFWDN